MESDFNTTAGFLVSVTCPDVQLLCIYHCFIFSSPNTPSAVLPGVSARNGNTCACSVLEHGLISRKRPAASPLLPGLGSAPSPGRLQQPDCFFIRLWLFDEIKKVQAVIKRTVSAGRYRCRKQDRERQREKAHLTNRSAAFLPSCVQRRC